MSVVTQDSGANKQLISDIGHRTPDFGLMLEMKDGKIASRYSLRPSSPGEESRLQPCSDNRPGPGNRSEHRDFQRCQRRVAQPAAIRRAGAINDALGQKPATRSGHERVSNILWRLR